MQFKFELPKECLKHDKEMSYYNHNYYHIDFSILGDEILYSSCDVLYQECVDDDNTAYYTLGYFISNENDKFSPENKYYLTNKKDKLFIPCFTWEDEYYFIN